MLENIHKETFEAHLNTTFQVVRDGEPSLALELIKVSGKGIRGNQEEFALLFRGPLDLPLDQGMQSVEHAQLGIFDIFLVPVALKADGYDYEAVFNLLIDGAAL